MRTTTYAELLKIVAAKRYPKAWADSFFPQTRAAASDDDTPEAPQTIEST